ncbi:MAG TPA: nucleotidyltransferase family protein [Armatimonadota bacterium]|jgi:CTP:molybdopterin cytidylyltransferase MocA
MSDTAKIPAVVLAGGQSKPEVEAQGWPKWRALALLAGRPILSYVLDALRASETVGTISIVGPEELRPVIGDATLLPVAETLWDNIATGLRHAPPGLVLTVAADAPLMTPASIDDYVRRAAAMDVDFVYPFISKADCLSQCPGLSRTYVTLREGVFTGGNLMLVKGPAILAQDALIRKAIAARKNPVELARLISPIFMVKFLSHRATIRDLERQISRILNANARGLQTSYAEVGADLDSPEETPIVESLLCKRG